MLLITKDTTNKLVLTLSELTTISDPYYLWKVTCEQTHEVYTFILEDVSEFESRYNLFYLLEGVDVTFNQTGYYYYEIFEQDNDTNLDPDNAGGIVEVGRIRVRNGE